MRFLSPWFFLAPAACLFAQAPPPAHPGGPPTQGPVVKMEVDTQSGGGPELSSLPPDKVVLSIGDEKITAGELAAIVDTLPPQYREAARGQRRKQFAEEIVKIRMLAGEARKQKLDQTARHKAQAAFQIDNLLAGAVFQQMSASAPVDEKASRAWFDQHKGEYERLKVRHILVRVKGSPVPIQPGDKDRTEEEALAKASELRKKIANGGDFAELAKTESDDLASGQHGGDVGAIRRGSMVPSFEQAAFALPVGQVSEPVKTNFGYHLIRVDQKEEPKFEELRADIERRIRPEVAQKAVEAMRQKITVTFDPDYYGK
ncbi:MAG: peptidylprolyl isomerase [Bryobacteraceae bacterium]